MPRLHFFIQADNQPQKAKKEPPTPKTKYRLTNWSKYNKSLIKKGLVAIWLDQTTLAQ